jgi:predicted acetyltransferase
MSNVTLVRPNEEYTEEIRAYRQEWLNTLADGESFVGSSGLRRYENISGWITYLSENCRINQYMLINEDERLILGMIHFKQVLSDYEAEFIGHIGYGIRPSERRKGYAKDMLALCLDKCRDAGLSQVLILCEAHNQASRRTILACGGVFERITKTSDEILERYWIGVKKI